MWIFFIFRVEFSKKKMKKSFWKRIFCKYIYIYIYIYILEVEFLNNLLQRKRIQERIFFLFFFTRKKIFKERFFEKKNFLKYFSFKRWIFTKKLEKFWKKKVEKKNLKRRWKMTYKARIYPKFWAHSKKFQIKRVQDHEYTIDFGERYWAIKP